MACTLTFASLRIFSKDIEPEEISSILGVKPTKTTRPDTSSRYKSRREYNTWFFSTRNLSNSTENIEHIKLILNELEGKSESLELLRKRDFSISIFSRWDFDGQGGPYLSVEVMRKLVELGIDIIWDIHHDEGVER